MKLVKQTPRSFWIGALVGSVATFACAVVGALL